MGKWCEHMKEETDFYVNHHVGVTMIRVKPKYCFECGAKRPEKPKGLAEKLLHVVKQRYESEFTYRLEVSNTPNDLAQAALEHFEWIVDSIDIYKTTQERSAFRKELLSRMRESL